MINVQLHKLKATLDEMLLVAPSDHPLLQWLLGVGGIYASEPERSWFVGQLIPVATDLNVRPWEELKPYFLKVICGGFCETRFRELWDEVKTRRDSLHAC